MLINKALRLLLLLHLCTSIAASQGSKTEEQESSFAVVGYLPNYRIDSVSAKNLQGVTDLIYFSIEPLEDGKLPETPISADDLRSIRRLQEELKCRVLVCVGGWGLSKGFPALAAKKASRAVFIEELKSLCESNQFSGVDLDWEHPKGKEELRNLAVLVAEMRARFDDSDLVVTVAQASWQDLGKDVYAHVERVHLMSYDHEFPQATVEKSTADVKRLLGYGCPSRKIALGVPFYGRNQERKSRTYQELVGDKRWESTVDEIDGFALNGRDTIGKKMDFAKDTNLGGIMIWEVGQDSKEPESSLLQKIREENSKRESAADE